MLLGWNPPERIIGLKNVIVYGRAVTNVLQKIRGLDSSFDTWYKKYQTEMQSDPLLRYFYRLRSEVLKEGKLVFSRELSNINVNSNLIRILFPKPFNGVKFLYMRQNRRFWMGNIPSRMEQLEKSMLIFLIFGQGYLRFSDAPKEHLGESISDNSVQSLASHTLTIYEKLFKMHFRSLDRITQFR